LWLISVMSMGRPGPASGAGPGPSVARRKFGARFVIRGGLPLRFPQDRGALKTLWAPTDNRRMLPFCVGRAAPAVVLGALLLGACSPALDWREVRAESGALALFPCKPVKETRAVVLAGAKTSMTMRACQAAGVTYALASAELGDPARIAPALAQLKSNLVGNIGGTAPAARPLVLAGMTPSAEAQRVDAQGALPDGAPVRQSSAFFARGTWVFQATVMGPKPAAEAVETFFEGLKFAP
jgi:hypothetical protein